MKVKVSVLGERVEQFQGKRGPVKQNILCLMDMDNENRLLNTFDYVMNDEEVEKLSGKIKDKVIDVGITGLDAGFGGRLRAKGKLILGE